MEIKLDTQVIQKALDEQTLKATEEAFKSYAITSAIKERMSEVLIDGILSSALAKAIEQVDVDQLAQSMAETIARSSVAAASTLLVDSTVASIAKLRGYESYQDDYKAKMDTLRAEIKSKMSMSRKEKL